MAAAARVRLVVDPSVFKALVRAQEFEGVASLIDGMGALLYRFRHMAGYAASEGMYRMGRFDLNVYRFVAVLAEFVSGFPCLEGEGCFFMHAVAGVTCYPGL